MRMEPSPELQQLTRRIAQAIGDGDVAFLERHTSRQPGIAFLGTDPDEWWTDLQGLRQALMAQREAGVAILPGEPLAYTEGAVGWAVDRGLRFRVGGEETPFRMSLVYRREQGEWKMVHFHSSLGVTNAEAIGVELAT
jgi:hypothetical protein